MQTERSGQSKN